MKRVLPLITSALLVECFKAGLNGESLAAMKKLDANTSPEIVRKWLGICAGKYLAATNNIELPSEEWPEWINSLTNGEPMRVQLTRNDRTVSASIFWDYARGLHGLDVNSSTNSPMRDPALFSSAAWAPGIYVWNARSD